MTLGSHCRALLCAAALLALPLTAQNAPRVRQVSVLGSGQAIEVEIQTSAPVTPQSQVTVNPDRIILDFPGALPAPQLRALRVNRDALKSIRAGLFSANPPITRVVLDLSAPRTYQISSARNAVLVTLGTVAANQVKTVESKRSSSPRLAPPTQAQVQQVGVLGSGQAIVVEIKTSAPVVPETQVATGPDRIVIDLPGARPGPNLLTGFSVNRGALKSVRAGLFSSQPPVTRVVLDLSAPQPYQIFSARNAVMLKVGAVASAGARLVEAAHGSNTSVMPANHGPLPLADVPPPKPPVAVTFVNGMLTIHAERATLAKVLFEIQKKTGAEIAIPAGAESEEIVADLGPGPIREVFAEFLNGSRYNFVFVENPRSRNLQKAILTVREGSGFSSPISRPQPPSATFSRQFGDPAAEEPAPLSEDPQVANDDLPMPVTEDAPPDETPPNAGQPSQVPSEVPSEAPPESPQE